MSTKKKPEGVISWTKDQIIALISPYITAQIKAFVKSWLQSLLDNGVLDSKQHKILTTRMNAALKLYNKEVSDNILKKK